MDIILLVQKFVCHFKCISVGGIRLPCHHCRNANEDGASCPELLAAEREKVNEKLTFSCMNAYVFVVETSWIDRRNFVAVMFVIIIIHLHVVVVMTSIFIVKTIILELTHRPSLSKPLFFGNYFFLQSSDEQNGNKKTCPCLSV
jgi:hypothetical protein